MRDLNIKVSKDDLLAALQRNRDGHRAVFEEAFEGYRSKMIAELESKLVKIKAGERVDPYLRFTAPDDHTGDYDAAIQMLEMDLGTEVDLDQSQFRCYVMDDWGWKQQWTTSTEQYR